MNEIIYTEKFAEAFRAANQSSIDRAQAWLDAEEKPESRVNRARGIAHSKKWVDDYCQGKYVGEGSVHSTGIHVTFTRYFLTKEDAQTEVLCYPKSVKVKSGSLRLENGAEFFWTRIEVTLCSGNTTGERNETGLKRLARFMKEIAADYIWHDAYLQNFLSLGAFKAATGL